MRALGLVSGGVGVVGLGLGICILACSLHCRQDFNREHAQASTTSCPNRVQAASDRSTYMTDTTVEIAGFVAGGALLAAGVVMFLAGGNRAEPEAARTGLVILPAVSPGGAGITLHGGF